MRLFFRHVAPRLIGESSIRSRSRKATAGYGNNSQQNQSELKTISSKRTRNYNRMGDEDTVSIGSEERIEEGSEGDANSVKAIIPPTGMGKIVKTETRVVKSDINTGGLNNRESWKPNF